jgi:Spy/CpxP family protein refolding chaperone
MKAFIFGVFVALSTSVVLANTTSSYVGQDAREIKALSQQEIAGYLEGKGLGYAKAAELNHFPGPRHVLDLAGELNLTKQQVLESQALFDAMKLQAVTLGKEFIAKEKALELRFSSGSIDTESLKSLLSEIGIIQSNIRYVHLSAHIKQKALLTEHQRHLYDKLRGYAGAGSGEHKHSH